jgi:hypothetical protein
MLGVASIRSQCPASSTTHGKPPWQLRILCRLLLLLPLLLLLFVPHVQLPLVVTHSGGGWLLAELPDDDYRREEDPFSDPDKFGWTDYHRGLKDTHSQAAVGPLPGCGGRDSRVNTDHCDAAITSCRSREPSLPRINCTPLLLHAAAGLWQATSGMWRMPYE